MALRRRQARDEREHDLFPGFADVAEIGVGSLAVVFRAREIGTNRLVALKLLNVRDASERSIESFERESIALGALSSHPNIVTLYRTFRTPDGRPVLVLELCSGAVADRLHNGAGLPVTDAVSIGIKVAGALETAHRGGILHRDVKPQNILVTEFGEPALADFGVAMLQSSTQTTAGLFDFTTLHAAPELLEGGGTSAATDVYELASSLYQLIAGQSAFRAYDGESPASVILRILRDPVRPLSGADVPMALSDLLIRAMSKQMDDRPPTAAEFAGELGGVEASQGWPRTQFLLRDPGRLGSAVTPSVVRMPEHRTAAQAPPQYPPSRPDVAPGAHPSPYQQPDQQQAYAPHYQPSSSSPPAPLPPRQPLPRPAGTRYPHVEQPPGQATWSTPTIVPGHPPAPPVQTPLVQTPPVPPPPPPQQPPPQQPPMAEQPVAAPTVPTEHVPDQPAPELQTPPDPPVPPDSVAQDEPMGRGGFAPPESAGAEPGVPVWAVRTPTPMQPASYAPPQFAGDLSLDPLALRRRTTIRAGVSAVSVDDAHLTLRTWFRRTSLPWNEVQGFESRTDAGRETDRPGRSQATGRIIVLTGGGPIEMPGTRRPLGELRYVHALLDAYRIRGQRLARQS